MNLLIEIGVVVLLTLIALWFYVNKSMKEWAKSVEELDK